MKKKILMISSTWSASYIHTILFGMLRRLEKEDVDLYVFNAYDEALESEYHLMERAIYSLPDVNQFDGVILAINSVGNQAVANELAKHYHDQGKQVLSMELKLDGISSIGTDNYQAEYDLLEHMIEKHDCKVMNYVGGPEEHMENQERYRAFCDCLNAHGLSVDPIRVKNYSFREVDGIEAYKYYKEKGMHLPDVVVCANDNMALGYCTAAAEDGYYAPDDFKIVGFDNVDEGQNYYPSITSVNRNWEQIGYDSVEQLLDMINGCMQKNAYFQGQKLVLNESCGCGAAPRDFHDDFAEIYKRKLKENQISSFNRKSRKLLCGSSNMEDFQQCLAVCQEMVGIEDLAVCLNASFFSGTVETKMDYDLEIDIYTSDRVQRQERTRGLLPEWWTEEQKIYFFSPLHLGQFNFGYCVISYNGTWQNQLDHRTFMESICLGLEGIRQHANLSRMNSRLEDLYVRDAMTGMYNRFGYESFAKIFFEEQKGKVYVSYLDLDNLKLYNDRFGHAIGDSAIRGVTEAIRYAYGENAIYVRMGGDEFLVVGVFEGEETLWRKEKRLYQYLKEYSDKEQLPFSLSVSFGHISNDNGSHSLDEMIWAADHKMYQSKQQKKKNQNQQVISSKLISAEFGEIIEKIPDMDFDIEVIFNTLRRYVPDITSQYGVVYLGACIVEFGPNDAEIRKDMILYDVKGKETTNDYVIKFETGRGGFVSITTGIPKTENWTAEMKKDIYILSKTIYLMVGRAVAMQTLSIITHTDHLTGIANVRRLNQIMRTRREEGRFSSYCNNFINIKNMKLLNERYGDKIGDQLLIYLANLLKSYVGEDGCAARLGGDNFIAFIDAERNEELLDKLKRFTFTYRNEQGQTISVNIGTRIGSYQIQPEDTIGDVMNHGSIALHYAQMENHQDIVVYESYMKNSVLRKKEMEEKTPDAIQNKEFIVYYQPKADISDFGNFKLNGGEALIRWEKDGNLILPYEFIPVLEKTGLITLIDFYVFEQVCKDICEWQKQGLKPVRISSNFSRRHLKDLDFVDKIEALIRKYQVNPNYLEIEITESYDMNDLEVLKVFEERLHQLGVHLSVDDFGSGYASIKMIKNIVSDTIKLDKSIIDGIGENKGDEVIVQHMVQMIQSLGKEVIAEGVENEIQANFLRENDCFNIQGYLFGKPMRKEEFEQLLNQYNS